MASGRFLFVSLDEIHDRKSVVLDMQAAEDWMNPRELNPLSLKRPLVPAHADLLMMHPASQLANIVKNDSPELLDSEKSQQMLSFPRQP